MRCIFISEEWFDVHTYWGWFRLDRGAYQDYLDGNLWITRLPLIKVERLVDKQASPALPPDLSLDAVQLRERAAHQGVLPLLQELYCGEEIPIPFKRRMGNDSIDEMTLSVRASNGLMRANADTLGKLYELMRGKGLRSVRNLGLKSEREITRSFFLTCYSKLTLEEQTRFWQAINAVH